MLADDPPVDLVLHAEELLRLLFGELENGDAGPDGEHLGDLFLADLGEDVHLAGLPALLATLALLLELPFLVAERGRTFEVLGVDRGFLAEPDLGDLLIDLANVGRGGHPADPRARPGLVDQVDGLVRQGPVGDVAVGEVRGRDQRVVGEAHAVVSFVTVAKTLQDLDGVGDRRLLDHDRLEAALERGVLLEVLAVLVARRGSDGLQLTAGEHRLEDAGGVDRAFRGAGADQCVQLVDEQDDVAAGLDLLEHLLEALLEVAAIAGAGDERAEVERVDLLALEGLGDLLADDVLRQPFDDGGLADARLADQHRVVLGPARQDLHHALDLFLAADHRVELAVPGQLREVPSELVEHHRSLAAALRGTGDLLTLAGGVAGEELDHGLADAVEVRTELLQHLRGDALALADQSEQDVLGADVVVTELQRFAERQLENLLGARGERDVTRRRGLALPDDLLDLLTNGFERDVERLQRLGGDALTLMDQAEEDVLRTDVVVVEHPRFFLGEDDHPTCSVGESLEHALHPSRRRPVRPAPRIVGPRPTLEVHEAPLPSGHSASLHAVYPASPIRQHAVPHHLRPPGRPPGPVRSRDPSLTLHPSEEVGPGMSSPGKKSDLASARRG